MTHILIFRRCKKVRVRNINRACMTAQWAKCFPGKHETLLQAPESMQKCQAWWQTPETPTLWRNERGSLELLASQHSLSPSSRSGRDCVAKTSQIQNDRKIGLYIHVHAHNHTHTCMHWHLHKDTKM